MPSIIQDFAKIINSRISKTLLVYFGLIFCLTSGFMIGRTSKILDSIPEVNIQNIDSTEYQNNIGGVVNNEQDLPSKSNTIKSSVAIVDKSQIFASSKGKYFYYKGCGGTSISKKNLVYYKSEAEAMAAGKIIYNKCK